LLKQAQKEKVIAGWLQGKTRDEIATEVMISQGSVTNVIKEWSEGLDDASTNYPAVRDLAVQSRKFGMNLQECAQASRLINVIKSMDVNGTSSSSLEKVEMIVTNIKNTCIDLGLPEEKLLDILIQVFELSNKESIHLASLPYDIKKKVMEKKQLEQDLEKLRKQKQQYEQETSEALQKRNLTTDMIKGSSHIKEELEKLGIPFANVQKMINAINNTGQIGYEPAKIAAKFSNISSLEKEEQDRANNCLLLKQKADRYQPIFGLCEQLTQLNIHSDQIESVVRTIIKIAKRNSTSNSISSVAQATSRFLYIVRKYDEIEELDTRDETLTAKIIVQQERLEKLNNFWARKNYAIKSLIKLHCNGVSDDHILYLHGFFSRYCEKIKLASLDVDLEQYADLKEALEHLSVEKDRITTEISLLERKKQSIKGKIHVYQVKLSERIKIMRQLSRKVHKASIAYKLPTTIFSTDTQLAILSNIFHQKSEEKEKAATNKMTIYNADGKVVV
jgi:chaperonin cofactor prefoldin